MIHLFGKIQTLLKKGKELPDENPNGFGTIKGVYIPSILMMFGVILFLRLGLVTAYLGPFMMAVIILLSLMIMLITAASITSVVTNMRVGSGGVYFLISRSLGIELGGAIGILLYFCQIISVSLCTTGFALALCDVFPGFSVEAVEIIALVILTLLSFYSTDAALKTQFLILIVLVASIISVFFGSYEHITVHEKTPFFPQGLTFWQGFALFYPAMTGIEAGMALSGTLKNPSKSLALGTVCALLTSGAVYFTLAMFLYFAVPTTDLQNDPLVLLQFGAIPSLVLLGIWGATLSSVLASLIGAPRMLQAIAEDGIAPSIFKKTFGKNREPRFAIALTFVIALFLMLFTTIDQIIPLLAMICLISYGVLNLVTAFAELIASSHWRPLIRTPWIVSFFGAGLCFTSMFFIDVGWTLAAFALVVGIYLFVKKQNIETSFEDIRQSILFFFSRIALYKLAETAEHAHHWHPQLIAFMGSPKPHTKLIYFSHALTNRTGVLTFATIVSPTLMLEETLSGRKRSLEEFYQKLGINCLVELASNENVSDGIEALIKSYGIGPFQPNTVLLPVEKKCPLQILEIAEKYGKNVILFTEDPAIEEEIFSAVQKEFPKRIDIWWDSNENYGIELMLSYVKSLTESILWRKAKVHVHSTCRSDDARKNMLKNYRSFVTKSRLKIKPHVHIVAGERSDEEELALHSTEADLVCVLLKSLSNFETPEEYEAYFESSLKVTASLRACAYVISNDSLDHKEIYRGN